MNGIATDLFQTEAWFNNLLETGFVEQPKCFSIHWQTPAGEVSLRLMLAHGRLHSLSNYYTCVFGPQGSRQAQREIDWPAFVARMGSLPGASVVNLRPLDASSEWLPAFEAAAIKAGYWTDRFFCFGNWYQPVPAGGYAVYWTQRPSALRHSVERGRRRLDKGGDWSVSIVTSNADDLDTAIAAYEQVYAQSWKLPEPCPGFIPGLIRTAAREGWLRLGVLRFNGQPLASQLWLVHAGKANIYKLAYVKGFENFSAGWVLTAALMQYVMEVDGVGEVDFLSGDDAYKADWMAMRRERVGLLACHTRHWRGWLAAGRQILGRWRRSISSSSPQRLPSHST